MSQLFLFEGCADPYDTMDKLGIIYVGRLLFGDRVKPQVSGPNYKGLCVFHNENSPSFYLKPAWNWFKCYGCGQFGGPVGLIYQCSGAPEDLLSRLAPEHCIDELIAAEERKFGKPIGFGL